MSTGMCFAAALMTHLVIPCHEIPVRSQVSPSLSLFLLLVVETTVEMFSRGLGLAVPGVERSPAVFQSGRCTLCRSCGGRRPATFPCAAFYLRNNPV